MRVSPHLPGFLLLETLCNLAFFCGFFLALTTIALYFVDYSGQSVPLARVKSDVTTLNINLIPLKAIFASEQVFDFGQLWGSLWSIFLLVFFVDGLFWKCFKGREQYYSRHGGSAGVRGQFRFGQKSFLLKNSPHPHLHWRTLQQWNSNWIQSF